MNAKPLPNESTKGLHIFLRILLVAAQILILAFIYALTQIEGRIGLIFSAAALLAGAALIFILEKTLNDDSIIRHAYNETKTFSLWRFVRLVFIAAGLWVDILSLWEKLQ